MNVLVRSQELPLFARLGPHPRTLLADALGDGELFEYWAHMAAIVPSAQHRLFRWRMAFDHQWAGVGSSAATPATSTRSSTASATAGRSPPPTSSSAPVRRARGGDWDDGKLALEYLFHHGQPRRDPAAQRLRPALRPAGAGAAGRRPGGADADRGRGPQGAAGLAARSLGVGTFEDLTDYHRQGTAACRPLVAELVEEGVLLPARVEGWRKPAYVHRDATVPRGSTARALLSPFDSLVWNRDRTERLFDFHYRIEIYTPRRSGCTATTCCRSCSTASSSGGSTSRPTGPTACCASRPPTASRVRRRPWSPAARRGAALDGRLARARHRRRDVRGDLAPALRAGSGPLDVEAAPDGADTLRVSTERPWLADDARRARRRVAGTTARPETRWSRAGGLPSRGRPRRRRLPRWVVPAVVVFWSGFLGRLAVRFFWGKLSGLFVLVAISVFLSLALEPGVNRLARRGWRRGSATALLLFGVLAMFLVFVGAIGTLVGSQIADLLSNSEQYITDTVDTINDTFGTNLDAQEVIDDFNDPDGAVQEFIRDQQDNVVRAVRRRPRRAAAAVLRAAVHVLPRRRRTEAAPGDLQPADPGPPGAGAGDLGAGRHKTGGYLYSRALLALISAVFHWIVFQSLGTAAPVALALWVGIVSQFLPVVGTYLAGVLPVLLTFLDSPVKALIVLIAIVVYQQIENYLFSPRITARTMELHPALAFGAALGGRPCSAPSARCWRCRRRRWARRSSASGATATRSSRATSPRSATTGSGSGWSKIRRRAVIGKWTTEPFVPVAVTERSGSSRASTTAPSSPSTATARRLVGRRSGRRDLPRSALKPLQAAAMVGAGLDPRRPAAGRRVRQPRRAPEHVAAVREILAGVGLGRADLGTRRRCRSTPTPSRRRASGRRRAVVDPAELQRQARRDAGHAVVNGWPIAGYLGPTTRCSA